jgi:hypothetical protein
MNLATDMARHSGRATPFLHDAPYQNIEETAGRRSTYPLPITVQTNRATTFITDTPSLIGSYQPRETSSRGKLRIHIQLVHVG